MTRIAFLTAKVSTKKEIQTHPNKTAYGHMTIGGDFLFKNKCEFYLEFTIVKI